MRLYSDEMDRLYSSFKTFFERREYLDSLAAKRKGPHSLTVDDVFETVVEYYRQNIVSQSSMTAAEAAAEIDEFLLRYKIHPMPTVKKATFAELLSTEKSVGR